jgi:hypothetical protein
MSRIKLIISEQSDFSFFGVVGYDVTYLVSGNKHMKETFLLSLHDIMSMYTLHLINSVLSLNFNEIVCRIKFTVIGPYLIISTGM